MEPRRWLAYRLVIAFVFVSALAAAPASGQGDRGQIAGFVKDESGGVIPGATVTITELQTTLVRAGVTDATGYYVFPSLSPAVYELQVELAGFKKWIKTSVRLDASSNISLDATLQTGTINESITVVAAVTPLQTEVALRKTIEAKDIELLSFSGRNPIGVVSLKAGVMGARSTAAGSTTSATAASTSTAAARTKTQSRSTGPSASARVRPAPSSAFRTSTPSRKSRCSRRTTCPSTGARAAVRSGS